MRFINYEHSMSYTADTLMEGDEMVFTMWLGPFPICWLAFIEVVSPSGFTDRQLRDPFVEWFHRPIITAVDDRTTDVVDESTLHLRSHLFLWWVARECKLAFPYIALIEYGKQGEYYNDLQSMVRRIGIRRG